MSLGWTYITLGWRVRKARKAFEKQLIAQGMSKRDAQQLSLFYVNLKNGITASVMKGFVGRGFT